MPVRPHAMPVPKHAGGTKVCRTDILLMHSRPTTKRYFGDCLYSFYDPVRSFLLGNICINTRQLAQEMWGCTPHNLHGHVLSLPPPFLHNRERLLSTGSRFSTASSTANALSISKGGSPEVDCLPTQLNGFSSTVMFSVSGTSQHACRQSARTMTVGLTISAGDRPSTSSRLLPRTCIAVAELKDTRRTQSLLGIICINTRQLAQEMWGCTLHNFHRHI